MKHLFALSHLLILILAAENSFASYTVTEFKSLLCIAVHSNAPLLPVFKFESSRVYNQVVEKQVPVDSRVSVDVTSFESDGSVSTENYTAGNLPQGSHVLFSNVDFNGVNGKSLSVSYKSVSASAVLEAPPTEIKQDFFLSDIPGDFFVTFSVDSKMSTTTANGALVFSGPVHCQGQMSVEGVMGGLSPFHNQN